MNLKTLLCNFLFGLIPMLMTANTSQTAVLNDHDLNRNWQFWTESEPSPCTVDLPHDAQQVTPRTPDAPGGNATGFVTGGIYHYKKTFQADAALLQQHVTFQFEGVYRNATVLINGQKAGFNAYGYSAFEVCADGFLHEGENTLEVVADNSQLPNSRWYSGGGIYRPIHVKVQNRDAYLQDIHIRTLSVQPAVIEVLVDHQGGEVSTSIQLAGKEVAHLSGDNQKVEIAQAQLWSAENPTLYQAKIQLKKDGKVVENRTVEFGIRQLTWNAQQGLLVNGVPTLLKGGCVHHDNGVLGACEYDDAAMRRIAQLKAFGFNAIRSAHNPCSDAVLRACDKLGMYVMDELWDMWYVTKNTQDYALQWRENWPTDVKALIRKDELHPSVILYSIGNEVGEPHNEEGYAAEKQIVDLVHQLDSTRPVTCGLNLMIMMLQSMNVDIFAQQTAKANAAPQQISSEQYNEMVSKSHDQMMQAVMAPPVDSIATPACNLLDISGYNYGSMRYAVDAQLHPERLLVGSETMPYDLPENWAMVEKYPTLVGDFMWTAWDYLGECGIGAWYYSKEENPSFSKQYPWVLADVGAFDLLGNPNGEAFRAKAIWQKDDKPYLTVRPISEGHLVKAMWRDTDAIPSWSWQGQEGKTAQVEVYTSAPKVRLYLNNALIGEKETERFRACFELPYQPGTLKAVSVSADGKEQEMSLTSATGAAHIAAYPEKTTYQANELIFVDVALEGDNGVVISNVDQPLQVKVEGARLLGFGSGKQATEERFLKGEYTTHQGHAQAILLPQEAGTVKLTVRGEGLKDCTAEMSVK